MFLESGITLPEFWHGVCGKEVFFLGAGISHRELIPQFLEHGAKVTLCDADEGVRTKEYLRGFLGAPLEFRLGPGYLSGLEDAALVFRTPGIDYTKAEIQRAVAAGVEVTSEIECFFRFCPCKIIGVTGSDGKTTTTTLIGKVLEAAGVNVHIGGNIGRPLFPVVDTVRSGDVVVVELSSFQLISMRQSPNVAVVTNVTPNHLDHHRDMDEYIDAKRNILRYQQKSDTAVLNSDNAVTAGMRSDVVGTLREFGRNELHSGAFIKDGLLFSAADGNAVPVMPLSGIALRGEHNRENVAAAYAAVSDFAVDDRLFCDTVSVFPGVEHRIERVREKDGVVWFNDSIATSPTRTAAGLRSFDEKVLLIAGGSDKGLPYDGLAAEMDARVKKAYLIGATAEKIEDAIKKSGSGVPVERALGLEDAVRRAGADARPGDVVLLSPASPSFDSYRNFEERGRHFKAVVQSL